MVSIIASFSDLSKSILVFESLPDTCNALTGFAVLIPILELGPAWFPSITKLALVSKLNVLEILNLSLSLLSIPITNLLWLVNKNCNNESPDPVCSIVIPVDVLVPEELSNMCKGLVGELVPIPIRLLA